MFYLLLFSFYVFILSSDTFGPHDGNVYHALALESSQGTPGACGLYKHAYWTPGWVETLGVVYRLLPAHPKSGHFFLLLVILAQSCVLYILSGQLWKNTKAQIAAPILFMSSALVLKHSSYLQYELYLGLLLTSLLLLFLKIKERKLTSSFWAVVIGFISVLILLVSAKAILSILFLIFFSTYSLIQKKNIKLFFVYLLSFSFFWGLWIVRNHYCFKEVIPFTTNGGVVFYIGNNPNTDSSGYNDPYLSLPPDVGHIEVWEQKKWYSLAKSYIKDNPGTTLNRMFKRFIRFFNPHYVDQILVIILFVFSLRYLWRIRYNSFIINYSLVTIFSFALLHAIYLQSYRYVLPVWPLLSLLASGVFVRWRQNNSSTAIINDSKAD
jgi:hypothetical protein